MALALISLLIWWWSSVATLAPRVGLQPEVGIVLAELFAPGKIDFRMVYLSKLSLCQLSYPSTTYLAGELSSSKAITVPRSGGQTRGGWSS